MEFKKSGKRGELLNFNHNILIEINERNDENKNTILTSISKSEDELENFKEILEKSANSPGMYKTLERINISKNYEEFLLYVLNYFEADNRLNSYVSQFINGKVYTPLKHQFQ